MHFAGIEDGAWNPTLQAERRRGTRGETTEGATRLPAADRPCPITAGSKSRWRAGRNRQVARKSIFPVRPVSPCAISGSRLYPLKLTIKKIYEMKIFFPCSIAMYQPALGPFPFLVLKSSLKQEVVMERMNTQVMVRCTSKDREKLKDLSDRLQISQSSVARVALAQGLKIVLERGICVDGAESEGALEVRGRTSA
jgi:hypothetical protein